MRVKYTTKFKETYGDEADPHVGDFDPKVAIAAGGGRPGGRMAVHVDSVITSTLPRLSTIQAMSTSSSPTIEPRIPHSVAMFEEIQTRLDDAEKLRSDIQRE